MIHFIEFEVQIFGLNAKTIEEVRKLVRDVLEKEFNPNYDSDLIVNVTLSAGKEEETK